MTDAEKQRLSLKCTRTAADWVEAAQNLDSNCPEDKAALGIEIAQALYLGARFKKALEDLTPGGSEFVNEPEVCAKYVKERLHAQHELILELQKEVNELRFKSKEVKTVKYNVELFSETGKWKYSATVEIPETMESWNIRSYLVEQPIPMDGVTCTSADWIRRGGFIFVDRANSYPLLIIKK